MRVNIVNQGTGAGGGFDIAGATLTGPLILADDPKVALEAATKRYIDVAVSSLNAGHIVTGTLPVGRLPAFTGDLSNVAGTNNFTLGNTTVTPGTYTKVTVDAKGRVTAGASLTAADIPALNWSKITDNKPTTVAGFGITDAVKSTTDSMTGPLTLHAHPTAANHAVTKGYVDTTASGSAVLATGDTIRRTTTTTPTGFLRCNGGVVSKTTYSALYAVIAAPYQTTIEFDYANNAAIGAGKPWEQQYDINKNAGGILSAWTAGTSMPMRLSSTDVVVTKNRVYIIGGWFDNGASGQTYSAPIDSNGVLGAWVAGDTLQYQTQFTSLVVIKNIVYALGGIFTGGNPANVIMRAPINADGTLGTFIQHNTSFPTFVSGLKTFVTKNRVYAITGYTVYTAPIDSNGSIGAWTVHSDITNYGFTDNNSGGKTVFVIRNNVYLAQGTTTALEISKAPINADGTLGAWTRVADGPANIGGAKAIVTRDMIYMVGGTQYSSGVPNGKVYTVAINADGTLGAWTEQATQSHSSSSGIGFATSSRIYLLGGYDVGVGPNEKTQWASINGATNDYSPYYNGTVNKFDGSSVSGSVVVSDTYNDNNYNISAGSGKPWQQQYDFNTVPNQGTISSWSYTNNLPVAFTAFSVIVTKSRVFFMGGYINNGVSSSVYSAPIQAGGIVAGETFTATGIPALPAARAFGQAFVTKNRVYYVGGIDSGGTAQSTVYMSTIDSNGNLSTWSTVTPLPSGLSYSQAIVTVNRVYLLGGHNAGGVSSIMTAPINADGTLGTWSTIANALPATIYASQAVVTKNRVTLIGGVVNGSNSVNTYTAPINADGTLGTWSQAGSLPMTVSLASAIVTRNLVYVFGGQVNGTQGSSIIHTAPVNADGTLGTWVRANDSTLQHWQGQAFVTSSRVYLAGLTDSTWASGYNIQGGAFSGGVDDYSGYINGSISAVDPNTFKLPDTTTTDPANIYTFIKF